MGNTHWILPLLLLAALWGPAWSGFGSSKDPNVRDWGDYSDLPTAVQQGPEKDHTTHDNGGARGSTSWSLPLAPELDFLAEFAGKSKLTSLADVWRFLKIFCRWLAAPTVSSLSLSPGKKRLWVITAPSHNNHYLRMMEKQLEDAERAVSCMIICCNSASVVRSFCFMMKTVLGIISFAL